MLDLTPYLSYIYGVMFKRILTISNTFNSFLFGARSTGKTTLLQKLFTKENFYWFDLLDIELEDRLAKKSNLLLDIINSLDKKIKYIIIDEIQKLPKLLDLIHQFLQKHPKRFIFILTGSSARKLKSGGANLLAGRAFVYNLYPLTFIELNEKFDLNEYLKFGGLPQVFTFKTNMDKNRFLKTYTLTYLKEEIWAEHIIKKLEPFRNFLEIAAQLNGDIINYTKIARQINVDTKTVQNYFEILQETLLGITLNAYHTSIRKQIIQAPKFYFIDPGIKRALDNTLQIDLMENTYAFGKAFEHFIIIQLYFLNQYYERDYKFYYFYPMMQCSIFYKTS
jgi:predicted AAA+ superfamily ATPase